ncbi:MAG: hypothetical protein KBD17_01835 [Candidatus Pacebacteria bacterium]|nr:hypothetical protein [Candidatus Paceibacterota bacterium]
METKNCKKCEKDFELDSNDLGFYEKMKVPAPNVCPDCRFKMKALFRNETTLYTGRKCALCDKNVISIYNPKSPYTIYCYKCFYSDKWNPSDFAMEYDESRGFLEQFKELMIKVPKINLGLSTGAGENINSEYSNMAGGCRNCYMVFNTSPAEDLCYSRGVRNGKDSMDIYFGSKFDRCYESLNVQESSGILWGKNISGSVDSAFVINCRGLINCFGCVNLNNKSYYFLNQPLPKEEYEKKVSDIMGSYEKIEQFKKEFQDFVLGFPMRENNNIKNTNSVGDYLFECKNVRDSFEVTGAEDCRYLFSTKGAKDSIGMIGYGMQSERLLEVVAGGYSSNIIGSFWPENCQDSLNCFDIRNCKNCVGCDALRYGEYSILNKSYTKEEYERLKGKIVAELTEQGLYGLIMPPELAPFAYNETIAQDNLPLTKEEALAQGFRWEDDIQMTTGRETLTTEEIPDQIKDVSDSICKEVLICMDCDRNYKITEQELLFYRKMILPIPRKCFFCRHKDRVRRRGSFKFFNRNCDKCNKETYTNVTKEIAPIMYCEKCYQQEVY